MDDALLEEWAARIRMTVPAKGPDVVRGWADREGAPEIRRSGERFAVTQVERGDARVMGTFDSEADANRYLLLLLGKVWRSEQRRIELWPGQAAPGATITEHADGVRLA